MRLSTLVALLPMMGFVNSFESSFFRIRTTHCSTKILPNHRYYHHYHHHYRFTHPLMVNNNHRIKPLSSLPSTLFEMPLMDDIQKLTFSIFAFAASHIGMSATRTSIIQTLGSVSNQMNLVGRPQWKLPKYWPGDSVGKNQIFPNEDIAGRQLYRGIYTLVSFLTLGSALMTYLQINAASSSSSHELSFSSIIPSFPPNDPNMTLHIACMIIAALSLGASIASLVNPSPLGLMPGFEWNQDDDDDDDGMNTTTTTTTTTNAGILTRKDSNKLNVRGLTRITRHPLILPVVPWGIATSYLAGGRLCDYIFFTGLSLYAIVGCAAQDMRVYKKEGSVGTVFFLPKQDNDDDDEKDNDDNVEQERLLIFLEQTSFVPFGAVLEGRQRMQDILQEVPWVIFMVGSVLGVFLQWQILHLLLDQSYFQ